MALAHTRMKALSRSKGNTVRMLAYRAGTNLRCELTGELFTYVDKPVQHVELLLPKDAPGWAKDLQVSIAQNRRLGVQQLSDMVEASEKRKDAQVYREFEFALPRELNDEQCIELARELIQDQVCAKGITVLLNFHFDVDEETGERKPHCHAVMLTRELTENGLSPIKNREWNSREFCHHLREKYAAYTNFYLAKYGYEQRIDHRSYKERGIELEPQPKLGYGVSKLEAIEGNNPKNIYSATVTDKGAQFQKIKLRNLYRLVKNPEMVFEIVTKNHATFMWGDVEQVLGRYIDDLDLFQRMNAKLKASHELVLLRRRAASPPSEKVEEKPVYTTRAMLKIENNLVSLAEKLSIQNSHSVDTANIQNTLAYWDQKLGKYGGLSLDQKAALQHMVGAEQLSYVVGYAGAGKTTVLEAAKEIWEANGYQVYGLAPTGRAAQNLDSVGIKSQTVHKFLKGYGAGRNQLTAKSVLVLDEAGMVDVARCEELLTAVKRLGVKLVGVGDGAQLQSVESGVAFRLITERILHAKLETVVRQKEDWQREATQLFGQLKTAEAVQQYVKRGCVEIVEEPKLEIDALMAAGDYRGMVLAYNQSRRVAGVIYHDMLQELKAKYFLEKNVHKYLPSHQDYALFKDWKQKREDAAEFILDHLDACRPYMQELGVDPVKFASHFVEAEYKGEDRPKEARRLAQDWDLPRLNPDTLPHQCDIRSQARTALLKVWQASMEEAPDKSQIILTYTNRDTRDLNQQARQLMKEAGKLSLEEYTFKIVHEDLDDFGQLQKFEEERQFAQGDRLVFLKNSNTLEVKNGTLGIILKVDHQNMEVKLDGEDRVVSFAPNLYPHIDHGWATTIHKAQGVTVDKSFVLATYQTYRNLAYVAFTRHREALRVFGSNLDFWRPSKVWEALAQSQDKLSSLDYLDPSQALKKMRRDDHIISRVLNKVGNRLAAMQVVSVEAWKRIGERFLGHTRPTFIPEMQGVLTEESRAQLLEAESLLKSHFDKVYEAQQETPGHIAAGEVEQTKDSNLQPIELVQPLARETSSQAKPNSSPYYDRSTVLDSLDADKIERLFRDHIHHFVENPKCNRRGTELRFGSGGGFVVNLKTTQWFSHYISEGGDLFKMISIARGLSHKEAIRFVGEWSGAPLQDYISVDEKQRRETAVLQKQQRELEERKRTAQKKAEQVYKHTQLAKGTLAEKYLTEVRGIQGEIPDTIRFAPKRFADGKTYPAVISFARDAEGKLSCYQDIMLDPASGGKARDLPHVKKSHGVQKGAAVTLQKGEGVTYIAEGLETGLSLKEAGVTGEILVSLGQSNIRNVPASNKHVVICGDYDGSFRANTEKVAQKNAEHLRERGYQVNIIWPSQEGNKKVDFNDLLKDHGVQKIKDVLKEQLPNVVTFKKDMGQVVQQASYQKQPEAEIAQPRTVEVSAPSNEKLNLSQKRYEELLHHYGKDQPLTDNLRVLLQPRVQFEEQRFHTNLTTAIDDHGIDDTNKAAHFALNLSRLEGRFFQEQLQKTSKVPFESDFYFKALAIYQEQQEKPHWSYQKLIQQNIPSAQAQAVSQQCQSYEAEIGKSISEMQIKNILSAVQILNKQGIKAANHHQKLEYQFLVKDFALAVEDGKTLDSLNLQAFQKTANQEANLRLQKVEASLHQRQQELSKERNLDFSL